MVAVLTAGIAPNGAQFQAIHDISAPIIQDRPRETNLMPPRQELTKAGREAWPPLNWKYEAARTIHAHRR